MSRRLRVAIAGTGFIGAVHARSARLAGARLVGVLSRAVVQRRLAEDEPPELDPDPGTVVL